MAASKHTTFVQLDLPLVPELPEEWRPVVGFEGRYDVSNHGRVRSLHFKRGARMKLLVPTSDRLRYQSVTLYGHVKRVTAKVPALVLEAFVGIRPPKYVCNHLDGNPANNRLHNLEWTTYQGNTHHAIRTGLRDDTWRRGETNNYARYTTEEVRAMRRCYDEGMPLRQIMQAFGGGRTTVQGIVKRKTWRHLIDEDERGRSSLC